MVFLASHAISPNFATAFHELRCEIHYDQVENFEGELDRDEWLAITPADTAAGRKALLEIVDKAIDRLLRLQAERREVADFLEEVQCNLPSHEERKTMAQIQRHRENANRLVVRNIEVIERARRYEAEGWGKARREREKLKEQARRGRMIDERFVIDEHGTIHDAQGYDGDLEAGLARWEARNGRQPCEDPYFRAQGAGGGSYSHGIPNGAGAKPEHLQSQGHPSRTCGDSATLPATSADGTRSVPATPDQWQGQCHAEQSPGHTVQSQSLTKAEIEDAGTESGQVGRSDSVPLTLTEKEPATKIQNEIVDDERSEAAGNAPIEALAAGRHEGGETDCQEDAGGDDLRAPSGEEGCVLPPRAPEPVSRRERRRRRRDMARNEFERRRGVFPNEPDVSVGESFQGLTHPGYVRSPPSGG